MSSYKKISSKIEELTINNPHTKNKLSWLNITNAQSKEINYLRKKYAFKLDHLKSSMSKVSAQRPIFFPEDKYVFLILHFPAFVGEKVIEAEIDFFIGHQFFITIHNNNLPTLNKLFSISKKDQHSLLSFKSESSATLLYELLNLLVDDIYKVIDRNSLNIKEVEYLIFEYKQKVAVEKILYLRRSIINIRKILQNHKNILQRLSTMQSSLVPAELIKKQYGQLVEHSKRIWEMLDNQKEMIEILNDTNESLLNNRMTTIMKTLTIFTVILLPLNLVAAIFGMNVVNTPLSSHPNGFWIIGLIMILASFSLLLIFKSKKWLH
jgi:magnesium transporter